MRRCERAEVWKVWRCGGVEGVKVRRCEGAEVWKVRRCGRCRGVEGVEAGVQRPVCRGRCEEGRCEEGGVERAV